jgi:hypothetical protein
MITDRARMNDIEVPVALVALSENRSRIWLSLLLLFRTIITLHKLLGAHIFLVHGVPAALMNYFQTSIRDSAYRSASLATTDVNSAGSTGFGMCIW